MPRVYGGQRLARYWYVPAAGLVAAGVALAVVELSDVLTGGGGSTDIVAATPPPSAPLGPTATLGQAGAPTLAPLSPSPTTAAIGRFRVGDKLEVTGTGECLNVRGGPTLARKAVGCARDGLLAVVLGGPHQADGFTWWEIRVDGLEGWAVENYLRLIP
jgi:hypothetical protein